MNNEYLELWEVLMNLSRGAYVYGDKFITPSGEILYVDIEGNLVCPLKTIDASLLCKYLEGEK